MLPEAIQGEGAGAELVRTIRKIAQIEQRIETINAEIDQMNRSELARLKFRVEEASRLGRDLLSELAGALDSQIADAAARAAKARTGLHNSE